MDMTFDLLETPHKSRLHFNEFMLRIHQKNFHNSDVRRFWIFLGAN